MAAQPDQRSDSLTENVIENILSFLSVKELCGLSILSRRFMNSWRFCRDLSFDSNFARNYSADEYRHIISHVFENHHNTCADRFKLYYNATAESDLVSYWVERAIDLGIKELELYFSPSNNKFMLSYDAVDVESMKIMRLINCGLHSPFHSNGLRHLRHITLQNTRADPVLLESIFANCLSLRALQLIKCKSVHALEASAQNLQGFKTLVVKDCYDVQSIAIDAPLLRTFHYHGKLMEFKFDCDLPYLSDVILDIAHPRSFQILSHRNGMMISLAFVNTLTVTSTILEALSPRSEDNEYKEMGFCFSKLKEFHLVVAPESFINPCDVVIFLRKCPCIERVFIDLGRYAFCDSLYWEIHGRDYLNNCQIVFPTLKYIKIKGFTMKDLPVSMARYFLKNATHLQCLVLVKARIHHVPVFCATDYFRWGIISNATIEIYDYHKDMSSVMPQHLRGV